jgi:hypothetical protein
LLFLEELSRAGQVTLLHEAPHAAPDQALFVGELGIERGDVV